MLRYVVMLLMVVAVLVVMTGCPKPQPADTAGAPGDSAEAVATTPPAETAPAEAEPAAGADKPAAEGAVCKVEGEEGKPVEKKASGLQYVVLEEGTGPQPKKGQEVVAEYTGWLTDGTKFDSSKDHPGEFKFPVGMGRVIPGWDEAFLDMKQGERRKLIIPADLGYGAEGTPGGPIPPDATLVFEVKLVKIVK